MDSAARSILLGSPKRLQLEDYVMALTFVSILLLWEHPR